MTIGSIWSSVYTHAMSIASSDSRLSWLSNTNDIVEQQNKIVAENVWNNIQIPNQVVASTQTKIWWILDIKA
jgi:hypothetical protein